MIGSDRYVTVSGKPVLGRKTKWGLIEGEKFLCFIFLSSFFFVCFWYNGIIWIVRIFFSIVFFCYLYNFFPGKLIFNS